MKMPDDSMGQTDDLVARLRDAQKTKVAGHLPRSGVPVVEIDLAALALERAEAAERITHLERELDEAQTLRHKAEYHAGVLEAQNVVLRRELAEAQKERDRYGRLYLDEIDRAISIDDELVASKAVLAELNRRI